MLSRVVLHYNSSTSLTKTAAKKATALPKTQLTCFILEQFPHLEITRAGCSITVLITSLVLWLSVPVATCYKTVAFSKAVR